MANRRGEQRFIARGDHENRFPLRELTSRIIKACFVVHNEFGYGFLESVYRRALAVELQYQGIVIAQEVPFELFFRGVSVGLYRADLVVESKVIVETKTGTVLDPNAGVQLLNCVHAAELDLGLLAHFGPRVAVKRMIASEHRRRRARDRQRK